jgi:hypothetical protein
MMARGARVGSLAALVAAVAAALGGACTRRTEDIIPSAQIRVTLNANMRTDAVENVAGKATFVLVDAENLSPRDGFIALRGTLLDAAGAKVGRLRPEELYVPAGEKRTFALLDADELARPTAVGASVEIGSALFARRKLSVEVSDEITHPDTGPAGARVVIGANVTNKASKTAKVIVLAAFRDAAGKPLTRPFDVMSIGAGITRPVRFVGPPGSTEADVYLGQITF